MENEMLSASDIDQKVAGTLRVPSGKLRKTLFFLRLRHMECACYFE